MSQATYYWSRMASQFFCLHFNLPQLLFAFLSLSPHCTDGLIRVPCSDAKFFSLCLSFSTLPFIFQSVFFRRRLNHYPLFYIWENWEPEKWSCSTPEQESWVLFQGSIPCDKSIFINAFLLNTFDSMHQKAVSTNITLQTTLQGKNMFRSCSFRTILQPWKVVPPGKHLILIRKSHKQITSLTGQTGPQAF